MATRSWLLLLTAFAVAHAKAAATQPTLILAPSLVNLPAGTNETLIHLSRAGGWLCVKPEINGQEAGWFLIDTGSTSTCIDKQLADRLHLEGAWRSSVRSPSTTTVQFDFVHYREMRVGPIVLKDGIAAAPDLAAMSVMAGVKIEGLIGDDVLREHPFALDFRENTLTLFSRHSFRPPVTIKPEVLSLRSEGRPCVRCRVEDASGWFMIDTGDLARLALNAVFVHQHWGGNLRGRHLEWGEAIDLGGLSNPMVAQFAPVEILGKEVPLVRAVSNSGTDVDTAGAIGLGSLANSRLTFDFDGGHLWVQRYAPETLEQVLKRYDETAADLIGITPLMSAAATGRIDVVSSLLKRAVPVNAQDKQGFTALFYAANSGHAEIVAALLRAGSDANITSSALDKSPLDAAAAFGDTQTVRLLLAAGAKVNHTDSHGRAALFDVAGADFIGVAKALLDAGADPKVMSRDGSTAMSYAAATGSPEMIHLLIKHGAVVNGPGIPPLRPSAINGNAESARTLLDAGADVDGTDQRGMTPLMWAVGRSHEDIVSMLLTHGADRNRKSIEGKTARDYAVDPYSLRLLLFSQSVPERPASQ